MKYITAFIFASLVSVASAADRPNILWLTCEDNSVDWVGCYGNPYADTPNIDKLATEGFQYMHCYANVPVCAPTRSTWITGVYALVDGDASDAQPLPDSARDDQVLSGPVEEGGLLCRERHEDRLQHRRPTGRRSVGYEQGRLERTANSSSRSSW